MSFLNKKVLNFTHSPFGLDLSDLSVKVVQLEREGKKDKIVSFGTSAIPIGSIVDGEIMKKENVISAIKEAVKKAGPKKIRTKKVICSLPETKAFLRIISIPKMEQEEIKEAIKWEMEANIPLPIDQVYYDWQMLEKKLSKEANKIDILVVAVAKKVVDQFVEVLELSGLAVEGLEIESIAQTRSFLDERDDKKTTLIIDLGDRRTSFSISTGTIPCFTCSIPLSAQSMTDAISKGLSISFEEAEKTKLTYGIGSAVKSDPIFQAVKPVLENLVSELEKSIDFYLTGLQYSASIDQIIICGGGANAKGIIPYLSQRMSKTIELGNPWVSVHIGSKLPLIDRNKSVQYSTAIGLALKGIYYEDLS
ncbi:MAG: type IV pilus assembly protein PilM [Candidatus Moranbacteria bacterium]|nr:type IV pilus assembly protein PilM [Candidatus Moranbacteria bacterium]